jgi:hypothetical protein
MAAIWPEWREEASQSAIDARITPRLVGGRRGLSRAALPVMSKIIRAPSAKAIPSERSSSPWALAALWPWRSIVQSGWTVPLARRLSQLASSVLSDLWPTLPVIAPLCPVEGRGPDPAVGVLVRGLGPGLRRGTASGMTKMDSTFFPGIARIVPAT